MGFWQDLCSDILRIAFILTNLLILIIGCLTLYSAIVVLQRSEVAPESFSKAPAVSGIVVICLVILSAVVGCLGACIRSNNLLHCYLVISVVFLIFQIVLGITFLVFSDGVKMSRVERDYEKSLKPHYESYQSSTESKTVVDDIQSKHMCCGLYGKDDPWVQSTKLGTLIASCCKDTNETLPVCLKSNAYEENCLKTGTHLLQNSLLTAGIIFLVIGYLQLIHIAVVLFLIYANSLNRS